jgi:hypothetical protein
MKKLQKPEKLPITMTSLNIGISLLLKEKKDGTLNICMAEKLKP